MKKITISHQALAVLILLLAALVGVGYFVTPQLMAAGIERYEQQEKNGASMVLKDKLIHYFPGSEEARDEAFALADNFLQGKGGRVMIGPDFTTGGGYSQDSPVGLNQVIAYLETVGRCQKETMWKYQAYYKMGLLSELESNVTEAETNFLLAAQGFAAGKKDHMVAEVNGSLVRLYLETGKYQAALELIRLTLENYPGQQRTQFLAWEGDVYYQTGDYERAGQSYTRALLEVETDWTRIRTYQGGDAPIAGASLSDQPLYKHIKSGLDWIAAFQAGEWESMGGVQGTIYAADKPLSNVMVYLINEQDYKGLMNHFDEISAVNPQKTNALGEFEFSGIIPGNYFIVLGVNPTDLTGLGRFKGLTPFSVDQGERVDLNYAFQPKVKLLEPAGRHSFQPGRPLEIFWESVPQAASYNLHFTLRQKDGYMSSVYKENIQDTSFTFDPQGIQLRDMNFVMSSNGVLAPSAILGGFYPGAEIYFIVEAIDGQGDSISDSEGYVLQLNENYPSIQVEESAGYALSAGDRWILEQDYDQAEQAYLSALTANPRDQVALLSLARLYSEVTGKTDGKKAITYYLELLGLSEERFIVEEAVWICEQEGQDDLAIQLLSRIENQLEPRSFWFERMGDLYLKKGEMEKALVYYREYLNGQKAFAGLGPVIALLYQNNIPEALNLLEEKSYAQEPRFDQEGKENRPADIRIINNNLASYLQGNPSLLSYKDFQQYLLEIGRIKGQNRSAQVDRFIAELQARGEQDSLVQVLCELARDRR